MLSLEKFKQLRAQGLSVEQIQKFDSGQTPDQDTQSAPPMSMGKEFGKFLGTAGNEVKGAIKGVGSTLYDTGALLGKIPQSIAGAAGYNPPPTVKPDFLTPKGAAQTVGFAGEQIGEFFLPGMAEAKLGIKGTELASKMMTKAPTATKALNYLQKGLTGAAGNIAVQSVHDGDAGQTAQAGLFGAISRIGGKIPNALLAGVQGVQGISQVAGGVQEQDPSQIGQGVLNTALAALGIKSTIKSEGLLLNKSKPSLSEVLDQYRGAFNIHKSDIRKIETKGGKSLDNVLKFALEEKVIPLKTPDGKMHTIDNVKDIRAKGREVDQKLESQLNAHDQRNDLEAIRKQAKARNAGTTANAEELRMKNRNVDRLITAEIQRYGRTKVTDLELHKIKQGMWSVGYDMNNRTLSPVAKSIGFLAKDTIQNNNQDLNIQRMNGLSGQYQELGNLLEGMHGNVVTGGKLGKWYDGAIGSFVVDKVLGNIPGVNMVAPIIGRYIGGKYNEFINNPQRIATEAIKQARRTPLTPRSKEILDQFEAMVTANQTPKDAPRLPAPGEGTSAINLPGKGVLAGQQNIKPSPFTPGQSSVQAGPAPTPGTPSARPGQLQLKAPIVSEQTTTTKGGVDYKATTGKPLGLPPFGGTPGAARLNVQMSQAEIKAQLQEQGTVPNDKDATVLATALKATQNNAGQKKVVEGVVEQYAKMTDAQRQAKLKQIKKIIQDLTPKPPPSPKAPAPSMGAIKVTSKQESGATTHSLKDSVGGTQ